MKAGTQTFGNLVEEAHAGKLRLPAFQRPWKWQRSQVLSLYDSLRKGFPIGTFLFLAARSDLNLAPRLFEGGHATNDLEQYVLDGQQRLTSGISLFHSVPGQVRYFLDLSRLKELFSLRGIGLDSQADLSALANDLDDDDGYCVARRSGADPEQLLLNQRILWTGYLADDTLLQYASDTYTDKYPEDKQFINYFVRPYVKLTAGLNVPYISLDNNESLEAVTKIFATLNTTGTPLTPFEIVVAALFSAGHDLRKDVEENKDLSTYYRNMDSTGKSIYRH